MEIFFESMDFDDISVLVYKDRKSGVIVKKTFYVIGECGFNDIEENMIDRLKVMSLKNDLSMSVKKACKTKTFTCELKCFNSIETLREHVMTKAGTNLEYKIRIKEHLVLAEVGSRKFVYILNK